MNTKKYISILFLLYCSIAMKVNADDLQILTEEDPPYSLTGKDGKPTGFGVEINNEIQKRMHGKIFPVSIQPWARVYKTVESEKNVVAFTMSRTKERENLFQWVGPIVENDWVFVAKKDRKLKLSNLEDAKKLGSIGSVRDYAWTNYLAAQGFKNLDIVTERKQNPQKADAKRIDAFVSADSSYKSEISEVGLNPDDYEIVMTINSVQMYIAHSKGTDKKIVESWQSAFDGMKADGTYAAILKKWLPNNKLPGPARPGSI